MFVISFNICLFIYFSVKYAIQSNDCDVFVNKQSIYLSIYPSLYTLQLTLFSSTEDLSRVGGNFSRKLMKDLLKP